MEGLYLYCIREKTENAQAFSPKGIDEKGEVFTLTHGELEAVVSKISLEEFGSSEIQKKAQEDLKWIKEKALLHQKVLEEAMKKNDKFLALIPMRFGIIFKEEAKLRQTIDKDYTTIKETLERIRGKQEWSVKVYLKDKERFAEVVKEKNEPIKQKQKEITDLPEGMAFFMEEELKEVICKEAEKELNNFVEKLFEAFKKHALDCIRNRILEKELTGRREPMVLNAAYLIPEERIEDFKKEIGDINQKMQAKGFYLEYSGPWPAYNFASY